jgi:hypothetical protein
MSNVLALVVIVLSATACTAVTADSVDEDDGMEVTLAQPQVAIRGTAAPATVQRPVFRQVLDNSAASTK